MPPQLKKRKKLTWDQQEINDVGINVKGLDKGEDKNSRSEVNFFSRKNIEDRKRREEIIGADLDNKHPGDPR